MGKKQKRELSEEKRILLEVAQDICDSEGRSTEYMIQFMQDMAGASFDEVTAFLEEQDR